MIKYELSFEQSGIDLFLRWKRVLIRFLVQNTTSKPATQQPYNLTKCDAWTAIKLLCRVFQQSNYLHFKNHFYFEWESISNRNIDISIQNRFDFDEFKCINHLANFFQFTRISCDKRRKKNGFLAIKKTRFWNVFNGKNAVCFHDALCVYEYALRLFGFEADIGFSGFQSSIGYHDHDQSF